MKSSSSQTSRLIADSERSLKIAKYPVRILHYAEFGVLLGVLLALGIHSVKNKSPQWDRVVWEDVRSPEPTPRPSPITPANPGEWDNPDRDGDGIPNEWETAHSHNPDNADDAASDFDNDGLTTLQEYQLWQRTNGQAGNPVGKWAVQQISIEQPTVDTNEYTQYWQGRYVAAANDRGDVVVQYQFQGEKADGTWFYVEQPAFLLADGTMQEIQIPGKTSGYTVVSDINEQKEVLLQWYSEDWSTCESYILKGDDNVTQITLDGNNCVAYRMNNFGDWIGWEITEFGEWIPVQVVDGMKILPYDNFTSWSILDINDYGQIIGTYYDAMEDKNITFTQLGSMFFSTGREGDFPMFNEFSNQWQWPAALNQWGEFAGGAYGYNSEGAFLNSTFFFDGAYHDINGQEDEYYSYPADLSDSGMVLFLSYAHTSVYYKPYLWRDSVSVGCDSLLPEENLYGEEGYLYPTKLSPNGKIFLTRYDASWQSQSIIILTPDQDSDGDGMPDDWEEFYGFDPHVHDANIDSDNDGTNNLGEFLLRTDPHNPPVIDPNGNIIDTRPGVDTDGDCIPNNWEVVNGMNYEDPTDAVLDFDRDGYYNLQEFRLNTEPRGAPSYRIRKIGPFAGVTSVQLGSATLGAGSIAGNPTYFSGDQVTEQVFFQASPTSGGSRPAMWSQARTAEAGEFSFYPTVASVYMNIVAQAPSGAMLTSHGNNPTFFTYWSSPTAAPIRLSGSPADNNVSYLYNPTFSPSGNYLFALRYNSSNGNYEPIVWKMPSSSNQTYKPVVITAPAGASLKYWMTASINDYGIIAANGMVSGQTRALVWTLNAAATSVQGAILPNLTSNGFTSTIGLSNHSNPIIAGNARISGNLQRATVWNYNSTNSYTATNLGTLANGNDSNIIKISPNGTIAGISNILSGNSLKQQIFSAKPVIPSDSTSIVPTLYRLMPEGEPLIAHPTITHVTNAGEILAILPVANSLPTRSLLRHGKAYPLDSILPLASGYELESIMSINSIGTLLVTAWNENSLETLILTPDRDTDGDGLPDAYENTHQFNPFAKNNPNADTDNDGLSDLLEFANATHPRNPDSDSDGMKDGWEVEWGFLPLDPTDALLDPDEDRVTNLRESQIGSIPTGIHKLEILHTDTAWQYPQILATGDDGTIVRTGSSTYNDLSTETIYGSEWSQETIAMLLPSSECPLLSNKVRYFNNDDGSYFRYAGEHGNYFSDASSQQIHGHRYHFDYGYDINTGEYFGEETFHLTPDIANHPDESEWITWDEVLQKLHNPDLHDGSILLEPWDYLSYYDSMVSPSGICRLHRSGLGQQLLLNERGELIELLPSDHYWQKINDHGVAACLEAWNDPDTNAYVPWLFLSNGEIFALPFQTKQTDYPDYEILGFSNDGKVLIRYGYLNQQPQWVNQYFLYDTQTFETHRVRLPNLGNFQEIKLSNNNGRLLIIGDKSRVVTPDGTSIRFEALRIQNTPSSAPQALKSLYPNGISPHHVTSDGLITAITTNNLGQRVILQITKQNDVDNDGIQDDVERFVAAYLLANNIVNEYTQHELTLGNLDPNYDYTGDGITAKELCDIIISGKEVLSNASVGKDDMDFEYEFITQRRALYMLQYQYNDGDTLGGYWSRIGNRVNGWDDLFTFNVNRPAYNITLDGMSEKLDDQSPWSDEGIKLKTPFAFKCSFRDISNEMINGYALNFGFEQDRIKITAKSISKKDRKVKLLKITRSMAEDLYGYSAPSSTETTWATHKTNVIELVIPAGKLVSTEWQLINADAKPGIYSEVILTPFIVNSADKYLSGNLLESSLRDIEGNNPNENNVYGLYFKHKQTNEIYKFNNINEIYCYENGIADKLLEDDDILSEAEVDMDIEDPRLKQDVVFYRKNDKIHFRSLFNTPGQIEIGFLYNGQEMSQGTSDENGNPLPPEEASKRGITWDLIADDDLGGLIDKLDAILSNTWSDNRLDQQLQSALYHGASDTYLEQLMHAMNQGPTGPIVGDSGHPRSTSYQHRNLVIKIMMPVWVQLDHCYHNGQMVNFEEGMILAAKGLIAMLKGYAEGLWIGLKSDLEGVRDTVVGLYKLVTEPRECARSLKESFCAMRDMTMEDWKNMAKKLVDDFLTKAEKRLPWNEPTGFILAQYVVGFSAGYLAEQIAVGIATAGASKAASAGKFGTIIADLVKIARGIKQGVITASGGAMKKAKTALFRWQSQFAKNEDAIRYSRKIADYSYKDYLPDCPGLLTP